MRRIRWVMLLTAATAVVAACGKGDGSEMPMDHHHADEYTFGAPADAAAADRVIAVETTDTLRFDPADLTVAAGETITFRVTNNGLGAHDFTLGDRATQETHAAEMAAMAPGMAHMADEPNMVFLEVGETKELTWRFTVPGEVLIGCHQPGHYEAGMVATITVTG